MHDFHFSFLQALATRRAALGSLIAACAVALPVHATAAERDWLADAGRYLYVTKPTKWATEVESWRDGKVFDTARLDVYLGDFPKEAGEGAPKTLVRFTEEGIRKGRLILYEGDRAWMYFKGTNQAIRIPLVEQLVGDADVASILNVDLRQAYEVVEVRADASDAAPQVVLQLNARKTDAPYASARLRLDAKTARPIDVQFHSLSGKLVKTVEYLAFQPHQSQQVLQSVRIKVHLNAKSDYTLIRYVAITSYELPRRYFSPALLKDL
jgi:Outer membrane lipoprotein-sorting protein